MALAGKGYFIWKIPSCEGGDPEAIATQASEAGLSHVLIKVADGATWKYNYDYDNRMDLVQPVLKALREKGIQVWGWHYVTGDDPIGEARMGIERVQELHVNGYVVDAEREYKQAGREIAAQRFMQEFRAALPNLAVGLSTYRYPRVHHEVPYSVFLEYCDYVMPQVYFEGKHNPEEQLERSVEQFMTIQPTRPVVPTAPTYGRGGWLPTPEEITRFFAKAKEIGLPAANAWSWDYARRSTYIDLWNAVRDFEWSPKPEIVDVPELLMKRMNQHKPGRIAELYHENAAHVTGSGTVIGKKAIQRWYASLLKEMLPQAEFQLTGMSAFENSRHFTWTAKSSQGFVEDGSDTIGLRNGRIQFHYTHFTVR